MFPLGVLAFALMLLGDINDAYLKRRSLAAAFPLGALALAVSYIFQLDPGSPRFASDTALFILWSFAGLFLILLIYSLFFSFPVKSAYAAPGDARSVCSSGIYALCRHPGVLWLFFLSLCLYFCAGFPPAALVTYTLLNILLVTFEDRWVFPRVLAGYGDYRRRVPFLIPSARSIGAFFRQSVKNRPEGRQ